MYPTFTFCIFLQIRIINVLLDKEPGQSLYIQKTLIVLLTSRQAVLRLMVVCAALKPWSSLKDHSGVRTFLNTQVSLFGFNFPYFSRPEDHSRRTSADQSSLQKLLRILRQRRYTPKENNRNKKKHYQFNFQLKLDFSGRTSNLVPALDFLSPIVYATKWDSLIYDIIQEVNCFLNDEMIIFQS